jgi:hypothetical protein
MAVGIMAKVTGILDDTITMDPISGKIMMDHRIGLVLLLMIFMKS